MAALALSPLLSRYRERLPLPVMARALLERHFNGSVLDEWFEGVAESQYTRELLFSTVFDLMSQVVFRQQKSVRSAYQHAQRPVGVSLSAVYDKLKGIEPETTAALVEQSAEQSVELIEALGGKRQALLPGVNVKVLDGNCLHGRQRRLKETRDRRAAPLPGKSLSVLDPALGLITALVPCEDAYTQERALAGQVVEMAKADELWIADRNFCTATVVFGLEQRGALSLIREHEQWGFTPLEALGKRVRIDGGWACEQRIRVHDAHQGTSLDLRRICIELDEATRDGDRELYLWTTLPKALASTAQIAELYRKRWTIETAFLKLTVELRCEIETLGYPRAALFAFAVAVVVYNTLAVVWAAMRAEYGETVIEEQLSTYHVADEMAKTVHSLTVMIDAEEWAVFCTLSVRAMARWLRGCAAAVEMRKYRKAKTVPRKKKRPADRPADDSPHLSTARVLALRRQK